MNNLFFELIQVSVGTRTALSAVPTPGQWRSMLSVARMQALVGVLFDGVERLPAEQQPPEDITMLWMHWQSKIKGNNVMMDGKAREVTEVLAAGGFGSCVLKGQGTALYYPKPELRKPGDIDIWVEGGRRQVLRYLAARYPLGSQSWHHSEVRMFEKVEVEVHHHPTWLCNPFNNRKLQRYFRESWPVQREHSSGLGFNTPTDSFAALYCLVHIYRHLLEEGVGLRQVCDFYYIVSSLSEEQKAELLRRSAEFGTMRLLGGMMYVLREVFGVPGSALPCPASEECGSFILKEILLAGNFGKYDRRNSVYKDEKRASRLFGRFFSRQSRFLRYFPSEVLWILPWRFWQFFVWRPLHTVRAGRGDS